MPSNIGVRSIIRAFTSMTSKRLKNDRTDGASWYYHGNKIAWFEQGVLHFNLCGWDTVTTRRRLNLVFDRLDINISLQRVKGETVVVSYGKRHELSARLSYCVQDFC